jgi:hypothetical protein
MAEEAKRSKPSAGTKVTFKVAAYVQGMENDTEFEGVAFMRAIPENVKGNIVEVNKLRSALIMEKCKAYGVKPLGALSAPVGTGKRAEAADTLYIGALKEAGCSASKAFQIVKVATLASVSLKALSLEELTAKYFTS